MNQLKIILGNGVQISSAMIQKVTSLCSEIGNNFFAWYFPEINSSSQDGLDIFPPYSEIEIKMIAEKILSLQECHSRTS